MRELEFHSKIKNNHIVISPNIQSEMEVDFDENKEINSAIINIFFLAYSESDAIYDDVIIPLFLV